MAAFRIALIVLSAVTNGVFALPEPTRFILASSPSQQKIFYGDMPTFQELSRPLASRTPKETRILVDGAACTIADGPACATVRGEGLRAPSGIALYQDASHSVLFVSDTVAEDGNIYKYDITINFDATTNSFYLRQGPQIRVVSGIAGGAQWLAVDGVGNLFFTTGTSGSVAGQVQTISADRLRELNSTAPLPASAITVLYTADNDGTTISQPGGIAADNFYLYWTNQDAGETAGTVVQAWEHKSLHVQADDATEAPAYPRALSANAALANGVCLARDTVFYTGDTTSLYAVKTGGNAIALVSEGFTTPKGCVYDSIGTLYVADSGANMIYSLPANMPRLRMVKHITPVFSVQGPAQVAIFSSGCLSLGPGLVVFALSLLMPMF